MTTEPESGAANSTSNPSESDNASPATAVPAETGERPAKEVGGRGGLDPTRYGDWEKNGRCIDF